MNRCGNCLRTLPDNAPSGDFCGEVCQKAWHEGRNSATRPRVVGAAQANIPARAWLGRRAA